LKENVLYLFVLFVVLGCGAQNNPIEEASSPTAETSVAEEASTDTLVNSVVLPGSDITLPTSVAMDFPTALKASSNSQFNHKVNRIQKVIDSEKYNFELLKLAIDEIGEACPESNATCNFEKDEFRVNYNHQTLLLGEINFNKYNENNRSSYDLLLTLNDDVRVRYQWGEDEKSVFTTYVEGNSSLKLHYFREDNRSEASYINDSLPTEKNSFMINVENNGSSLYFLTSNHIKNNKQEFSTKLRVEDKVLVEDNKSFFNFPNDKNESHGFDSDLSNSFGTLGLLSTSSISRPSNRTLLLDYIVSQELKDADYLVFDANSTLTGLNLSEQLKLSIGSFTYLKGEVFGLVFNEEQSDGVTEFKIISLN